MQATTNGYRIAWALLLLLAVANIAGYAFDLYRAFWWFDRVLHACTILAITFWLAVIVFAPALRAGPPHPLLAFLLIVGIGVAVGALWEVAEWSFDQIAPGNVIKGKHDTILDIVMDTLGAMVAGLAAMRCLRSPAPADPARGTRLARQAPES